MNYGIPYMGSKSKIVHLIRYILERHYDKKYFIDVFCGGFAVSHYVMKKSSKMRVLANDKNQYVIALINKILYEGLPSIIYDFVDRERFLDVIDNPNNYEEWYVGYVQNIWSFGNTQKAYLYGKDVEPIKHSMHNALVHNVWDDVVKEFEFVVPEDVKKNDYKNNSNKRIEFMGYIKRYLNNRYDMQHLEAVNRLENLERSQQLERLERSQQLEQLERLDWLERLERLERLDWRIFIQSVPHDILKNAIIYCDPPYENTAKYDVDDLSYDEFWQWFRVTPYCVYVSSYNAPDDINPLNFEFKNQTLSGGVGKRVVENIYWNGNGSPIPTMEDLLFNLEGDNNG